MSVAIREFNTVAKPKPKAPPPSVSPAGKLQLVVGKKYVTNAGKVISITKQSVHTGHYLSDDGWWYSAGGQWIGEQGNPDYPRHIVKEHDGVLLWEDAMKKHMDGVALLYRHKNILNSKWVLFPNKNHGGMFAKAETLTQIYGNTLEFKLAEVA